MSVASSVSLDPTHTQESSEDRYGNRSHRPVSHDFPSCSKRPPTTDVSILAPVVAHSHDGTLRNLRSISRDSVPKDATA